MIEQKVKQIGDYCVSDVRLGGGQNGQVFKGYFKNDVTRQIAVKVIPWNKIKVENYQKLVKSLNREKEALQKLSNQKNIVTFHGCLMSQTNIYFFLDYCDGGDLQELLKKQKNLSEETAVGIFRDIVNAFKACQENNIIHRDIKPANIMLKSDGSAHVGDLGFARTLDEQQGDQAQKYTILGTPLYMSPQILMQEEYSSKTDVWSVAVVFYEMLFNQTPFTGYSIFNLYENITNGTLVFPATTTISDQTRDILQKMLQKEENNRISWNDIFQHPLLNPQIQFQK